MSRHAQLVGADMSATRQTILTCRDGLKVASFLVRHARFPRDMLPTSSWHLLRGRYEETAPVEFRLKAAADLPNRSMLMKTYSPLSKLSLCAMIIISRTESGEAHITITTQDIPRAYRWLSLKVYTWRPKNWHNFLCALPLSNINWFLLIFEQEAFEKCWAHSPLRAAARPLTRCRYCRTRASMSTTKTTTTTTTRDRGDRYGPIEWAQSGKRRQ